MAQFDFQIEGFLDLKNEGSIEISETLSSLLKKAQLKLSGLCFCFVTLNRGNIMRKRGLARIYLVVIFITSRQTLRPGRSLRNIT